MVSRNKLRLIDLTRRYREVFYKNASLTSIIYPGSSYIFVSFLRHAYKARFMAVRHELVVPELDMIHFPLEPELQRDRIVTM